MSMADDQVKSQRTIAERAGVRWPSLARRTMRWVWREWDAEVDEVIEEGRDQVLIVARVYGEGAASGIRLDEWSAVRYTFREGRILRVDGAIDPDRGRVLDALAATAELPE